MGEVALEFVVGRDQVEHGLGSVEGWARERKGLGVREVSLLALKRRLEEIIGQLAGIGGGRPLGFGPQRVLSLPDGIARVLAEHLGLVEVESRPAAPREAGKLTAGDICPECGQATFVYEEGCKKCYGCGFNEC